jgi:PleD family two-component response regulator
VAERLLRFTRETDIIGRNADREFVFALPETDSSETQIVIERLRECVTGMPIQTEGGPIEVTIRMADVTTNGGVSDLDSLIERTRAALGEACSGVDRHRKYDFQYNKWSHDDFY